MEKSRPTLIKGDIGSQLRLLNWYLDNETELVTRESALISKKTELMKYDIKLTKRETECIAKETALLEKENEIIKIDIDRLRFRNKLFKFVYGSQMAFFYAIATAGFMFMLYFSTELTLFRSFLIGLGVCFLAGGLTSYEMNSLRVRDE